MDRGHGDSRANRRRISVRQLNTALYGSEAGGQNLSWAEAQRQMLAHQLSRAGQPPNLRIGRGATVERAEAEAQGRAIFAKVLYKLVPDTTVRLVNSQALEVERTYQAAHDVALDAVASDPVLAEMPYSVEVLASNDADFAEALAAKWEFVEDWQREFRLIDDWLADMAWDTMRTAHDMQEVNLEYRGPLGLGVHSSIVPNHEAEGTTTGREIVFEWGMPVYPVFVDDLKLAPDEAGFDMYSPDTETVKGAIIRLLEALRPRIQAVLECIEEEHRKCFDALSPVRLKSLVAFEWLVRYQVLGESMVEIAQDVGQSTGNISHGIREAEGLIGLTRRERGKSGPKSQPPAPRDGIRVSHRARTVKLLH